MMQHSDLRVEVKKAISRLHEKNGSDYESLMREVDGRHRNIILNPAQLVATISRAKTLILEWGRGAGKTTLRGARWSRILREMPRSTGLFIGPTYQAILTRIVPSLVQGLELFGIYKDLHYFIGRKPPRAWQNSWGKAYQPPERYDHYITFFNGMGVHLISHDVPGDGRGLNSDWIDGDEAALLNGKNLEENTTPTLRGTNNKEFKHSIFLGSEIYSSSTPLTPEGQWFLDYEQKAIENPVGINFISAPSSVNIENFRDGYLEQAREKSYQEWVYLAEYENVRPKFSKNGFYFLLDTDIHCYVNFDYNHYTDLGQANDCRGDADLVKGVPLTLGIDWGAAINCLCANQHLKSINEYRTLKSFYALGEEQKIQSDLFIDFHKYYQHHDTKKVFLWYDNTGNSKTGMTRYTRAEQARTQLQSFGWDVQLMTTGQSNVSHDLKFVLWEAILKEDNPALPRYRLNKANAPELWISMRNAKIARSRTGVIQKDKSSERSTKILRQHATDLSDANDTPVVGMFSHLLYSSQTSLPGMTITRN